MKKILSLFAAALVAIAVNAQTDFAAPGYNCTADDAVLSNVYGLSLKTDVDPHYIECAEATYNVVLATWSVTATRGCYVSVSLDLGPMYGSNKHIFQVKILDSEGHAKGTLAESAENTASEQVKTLDGTILLPAAGTYTVELYSIRQYGKGTIKNIILTYDSDAPEDMIAVTSIELNKSELALEVDEVEQLAATVLPEDAFDPSVTWQSSDNAVVTVVDGMVTAVAAGTATITATAGEQSATCAVTVSAASVPDVDFTEPLVLSAKKAHLEGAVWKMYDSDTYKLYGDGGSNSVYGTASWTIHVTRPCVVTGKLMGLDKGALYELDLMDAEENILGTIAQPTRKKWSKGDIEMDSINTTLTFPAAGNYTLKLRNTLAWSSGRTAGVTLMPIEYFLIGTFNEWAAGDATYKFAANPATDGEYMLLGVEFEANAEIKVISSTGAWYPNTAGNCTINDAGTYDIYFRPDGQGGSDWYYGYFWLTPSQGTAISNTAVEVKAVKMMENGQLVIIKNGVRYNVMGTAL